MTCLQGTMFCDVSVDVDCCRSSHVAKYGCCQVPLFQSLVVVATGDFGGKGAMVQEMLVFHGFQLLSCSPLTLVSSFAAKWV